MRIPKRQTAALALMALGFVAFAPPSGAEGRTTEFRFQLSSDPGSEFSARLPVVSAGSLKVEAEWSRLNTAGSSASQQDTKLTLVLLRPGGSEVARTSGTSPLKLEMQVSEPTNFTTWTVKIINASIDNRSEVAGVLRAAIPVTAGLVADKDFVLLGSGNAREIPFFVSGPGRLSIEASWEDSPTSDATSAPQLSIVLLSPAEGRTYVRKQGRSPITIEQAIVDAARDGARLVVRVQNDTAGRVKGRLRVRFSPTP